MAPTARAVVAAVVAFLAPLAFYGSDRLTVALPSDLTPVQPPVHRLQHYLRIHTEHPTPAYADAVAYLNRTISALLPAARLSAHEFVAGKPVLLVRLPGARPDLPAVLLNSHTDVVPVEADRWRLPPFAARLAVRDGQLRLYGRGAQDMKCVGMQYVEALANLYARGWRNERPILLTYVPDEEIGGVDGMGAFVKSPVFQQLSVGVALDEGMPNPLPRINLYYGERRVWWLTIKVAGRPGHGATLPERTAAEILSEVVSRAMAFRARQFVLTENGADIGEVTNVNIVYMKAGLPSEKTASGFAMNVIPSDAEVGFDMRVPPSVSGAEMDAEIQRWITCADGYVCPGTTVKFHHKVHVDEITSRDPEKNPFIVPFANGFAKAGVSHRLNHGIFFAATDARYLREVGIPCFSFSPLDSTPNLMHKHDEYIPVDTYLEGIRIYESVIKELADFVPTSAVSDADVETIREKAAKEMTEESQEQNSTDGGSSSEESAPPAEGSFEKRGAATGTAGEGDPGKEEL